MIFLYKCKNKRCGEEFEFMHVPKDEPAVCPKCSSKDVEKQFAPKSSHVLKGSGWYRDGYKGKKK